MHIEGWKFFVEIWRDRPDQKHQRTPWHSDMRSSAFERRS